MVKRYELSDTQWRRIADLVPGKRAIRVGTVIDMTARKRAERHLKIINDVGTAVAAEMDLDRIVRIILRRQGD